MTGLLTNYLGQGLASARPVTPSIAPGTVSMWFSTDTEELSFYDSVAAAWVRVGLFADIPSIPTIPVISDAAYDATAWNGNNDGATKNAIRDKFESLPPGALPNGGATGQVLTKASATDGDANWQTPGGSGLTIPLLADYPTILNAPTVSDGTGALIMTGASGGVIIRARLRTLPVGDFSVRCKMRARLGGNFNGAGLVFRDTGGRYVTIHQVFNQNLFIANDNFTNATTFANSSGNFLFASGIPEWLRADFNASNNDVSLFWSFNGLDWIAGATSGHLVTCDAWGLGTPINSNANGSTAFFEHIQII